MGFSTAALLGFVDAYAKQFVSEDMMSRFIVYSLGLWGTCNWRDLAHSGTPEAACHLSCTWWLWCLKCNPRTESNNQPAKTLHTFNAQLQQNSCGFLQAHTNTHI
jgi:hypothetical protein